MVVLKPRPGTAGRADGGANRAAYVRAAALTQLCPYAPVWHIERFTTCRWE